jgi:CheY-specific phosphatase CheX
LRTDIALRLIDALPERFDFYHLGEVQKTSFTVQAPKVTEEILATIEDYSAISFSLFGDIRGVLIFLFDKGLDASTYTEMGNILASQLASHLAERHGVDEMISPPILANSERVASLLKAQTDIATQSYTHVHQGNSVTVRMLIIPSSDLRTEVAHA